MRAMRRLVAGLRALLRRSSEERELDAELDEYLEAAIQDKVRGGATRDAAARAARVEMGSVAAIKDRVRDTGWESVLESVWQDVHFGVRMLCRSRAFTGIAIVLLALGIGANTAIFTLLNAVMLRTLPVREPAQLVEPLSHYPGEPRTNGFSWEFYEQLRDGTAAFSDVIGSAPARVPVGIGGAAADTLDAEYVVGTLFPVLGVEAALGRLIEPRDARTDAEPVAVVSWGYWKSRFNLDPGILGASLAVNGVQASVVGVTPRVFTGLQPGSVPAIWLPVRQPRTLRLLARLKPGVPVAQARAELRVLNRPRVERIARTSKDSRWLQADIELEPAAAGFSAIRDRFATPLLVLMATVGVLLLLACTNLASMLLARAMARRHEMAVRVSLGAGGPRLFRQVLTESLLLSGTGGLLGLALGYFGAGGLLRFMTSGRAPVGWPPQLELQTGPDARVLLFTTAIAVFTGIAFGLAPALRALASPPVTSLSDRGGVGGGRSGRRLAEGLVVAQIALSVVLVTAAAGFVAHVSNLRNRDLGFQRQGVLLVSLNPQGSGLNRTQLSQLYRELLQRFHAIPGVQSATLSGVTPIQGPAASRWVSVEGQREPPEAHPRAWVNWIAPRYFETMGTPVLAGRDFQFEDAARAHVAIVNQGLARHYFGDANPLGRRISLERETSPYEIVGVVADAKYADLREPAPRTVYLFAFQDGAISSQFALHTGPAAASLAPQVRRVVQEVVPGLAISRITTLDDQVNASIVIERLISTLSVLFGALGAILAALGLYGLLAHTIARRTREIGVRIALGASERDVMRMVLTGAMGLVCAGVIAGAPLAWWIARIAARLVPGLSAGPAWPLAIAAAGLAGIALLAAYVPARRAARIQPTDALRHGC